MFRLASVLGLVRERVRHIPALCSYFLAPVSRQHPRFCISDCGASMDDPVVKASNRTPPLTVDALEGQPNTH